MALGILSGYYFEEPRLKGPDEVKGLGYETPSGIHSYLQSVIGRSLPQPPDLPSKLKVIGVPG